MESEEDLELKKRQYRAKWLKIAAVAFCYGMMGYTFDLPAPLETYFYSDMRLSHTQYEMFYSILTFPNIITPFFSAYLLEHTGIDKGYFYFLCISMIGQYLFFIATEIQMYWLMLVGRFILGISIETCMVAALTLLQTIPEESEKPFALGLMFPMFRFMSASTTYLSIVFYKIHHRFFEPMLVGSVIVTFQVIYYGLTSLYYNKYKDKEKEMKAQQKIHEEAGDTWTISKNFVKDNYKNKHYLLTLYSVFMFFGSFRMYLANCIAIYSSLIPISKETLGLMYYIYTFFLISSTPFVSQWFKKRISKYVTHALIFATTMNGISFALNILAPLNPVIFMFGVFIGVSFIFYMYASTAINYLSSLIDKKYITFSMAVLVCIYNLVITLYGLIIGGIQDLSKSVKKGYWNTLLFFLISAIIWTIVNSIVHKFEMDKRNKQNEEEIKHFELDEEKEPNEEINEKMEEKNEKIIEKVDTTNANNFQNTKIDTF